MFNKIQVPDGRREFLVINDATTGQNALLKARKFAEDVGLTGVVITKLDSTAKGGFAFAVGDDLGVPIKFIGTGEKVEDLAPFGPQSVVGALFRQDWPGGNSWVKQLQMRPRRLFPVRT